MINDHFVNIPLYSIENIQMISGQNLPKNDGIYENENYFTVLLMTFINIPH